MEPNQIPTQISPVAPLPSTPVIINEKPKPGYFTRLFSGRLNRQNYVLGSTFFVLVPIICFMIVLFNILLSPDAFAMPYLDPNNPSAIVTPQVSIFQLLTTPANELWSAIGIIFLILSIPFVFSLQIRRLHDLGLNGWFWIVNFGSLLPLYSMFPSGISGILTPKQDAFFWISEIVGLIASFFSLYISLWPGTKGPNNYGDKPLARSSLLADILQMK